MTGSMSSSQRTDPLRGISPITDERADDAQGSQRLAMYRQGLVVVWLQGAIRAGPETTHITDKLSSMVKGSPRDVHVFMDLAGLRQYDSEVRVRYTNALANHPQLKRILVYADSRIVRMGASVAGMVLTQLRLVERSRFENELEQLLNS